MNLEETKHKPVFLEQALELLEVRPHAWYIDTTFGRGGHTKEILKKGGKVLALDFDAEAVSFGEDKFKEEIKKGKLILKRANFNKVKNIVEKLQKEKKIGEIQGILFDLGTSSHQLKSKERGFSFEAKEEDLDMRMDQRLGVKAKDLLAILPERQLADLFRDYGGEKEARKIAKEIARTRKEDPISIAKVESLVNLVTRVKKERKSHLHPATKVFQSLRIAVNSELENLKEALPAALLVLAPEGKLVSIAFHQGEDAMVKKFFKKKSLAKKGTLLTKKPTKPSEKEVSINPRSRSAKLRAFQKS